MRIDDGGVDLIFISIRVFQVFVNADEQRGTAAKFFLVIQGRRHHIWSFTLCLADYVEVVAVISILVQHGEVVDDDTKNCGSDRGERTNIGPHLSAVVVRNSERILQDEDTAADQATDVSERLSDLERAAHDMERPNNTHPDVERKVSVPRFEPD